MSPGCDPDIETGSLGADHYITTLSDVQTNVLLPHPDLILVEQIWNVQVEG